MTTDATSVSAEVAAHQRLQIGLLCDESRRPRYAEQYETSVGVLDVIDLSDADPSTVSIAIIDTLTVSVAEFWSRLQVPVLISPELLLQGFASSLPNSLDWSALMPWPYGVDVVAATELVAQGRVGRVWQGRVNTGVGEPPHPTWETDEWWAYSPVEALFGGLHVSEQLMRARISSTSIARGAASALRAEHLFEDGRIVMQTIAPSRSTGLPWLSAELWGDGGRIQINDDFAPGNIALWDSVGAQFVFPAAPFPKPNVQAADSSKGGWDIIALLASLLIEPRESRTPARARALRLAELAAALSR